MVSSTIPPLSGLRQPGAHFLTACRARRTTGEPRFHRASNVSKHTGDQCIRLSKTGPGCEWKPHEGDGSTRSRMNGFKCLRRTSSRLSNTTRSRSPNAACDYRESEAIDAPRVRGATARGPAGRIWPPIAWPRVSSQLDRSASTRPRARCAGGSVVEYPNGIVVVRPAVEGREYQCSRSLAHARPSRVRDETVHLNPASRYIGQNASRDVGRR